MIYLGTVVGELAVLAAGSRGLTAIGRTELQPAFVAAVVGLHFLPFAWAFREPMFLVLGGAVAVAGGVGFTAGALGVTNAADAAAVLSGLIMLGIIAAYALGRFAPPVAEPSVEHRRRPPPP